MKNEMTRKQKKEYYTRKKIISSAKKLFREKGYRNSSVDEIANESILSKGTFYHYFISKENLFLCTMKETELELLELIDEVAKSPSSFEETHFLRDLTIKLLEYFEKDPYFISLSFYRDEEFNQEILQSMRKLQIHLNEKIVELFIKKKLLDEKKAHHFALSFIGAVYLHVSYWFFNSKTKEINLKENALALFEQFYPYLRNK